MICVSLQFVNGSGLIRNQIPNQSACRIVGLHQSFLSCEHMPLRVFRQVRFFDDNFVCENQRRHM